jgi:HK97 family phage portal protein
MNAARNLIARAASWVATKATEGAPRPGPWWLPVTGSLLGAEWNMQNFWQCGWSPTAPARSAIVEACISAYAQTIAMCPGDHWRLNKKGGKERVKSSALSRILRKPNDYQSPSDFMLNLVHSLYSEGNAYAWAWRNDRYEVESLHLMRSQWTRPTVGEGGEVFYTMGGNAVVQRMPELLDQPIMVPQRDVLHVRLHTTTRQPWPLLGETPITAAIAEVMANDAIMQQQMNFYINQARPSAVLSTDLVLDKDQTQALRDRWNEQARGLAAGNTPILTAGLKVQPWGVHAKDADLAEIMKLTEQHIALVYRIPLQILGMGSGTYGSTEALMSAWIASGLGFALNHVEDAFGRLFALKGQPDEYVEFDTTALLRSAMKDRIEALARGVQGGIYAPNEARAMEGLEEKPYGDEPRTQQQVVPLSAAAGITEPTKFPTGPHPPPAPGPGAPPASPPAEAAKPKPTNPTAEKFIHADDIQREMRRISAAATRVNRHYS